MNELKTMLWNRCKVLLFAVAVSALFFLGINAAGAGSASHEDKDKPKNAHEAYAIRDTKVDPKLHPSARARLQRETAIKKRKDLRKFEQDVMAGKGPEGGAK